MLLYLCMHVWRGGNKKKLANVSTVYLQTAMSASDSHMFQIGRHRPTLFSICHRIGKNIVNKQKDKI